MQLPNQATITTGGEAPKTERVFQDPDSPIIRDFSHN